MRLLSLSLILFTTASYALSNQGLNLDWLEPTVSPSQNFYVYANGTWQKKNPIPPAYSSWSVFSMLQQQNEKLIQQIILETAKNKQAKPGSIEQKIGDYYISGMDTKQINELGIKPLQPEFERINNIQNLQDLQAEIIRFHQLGLDAFFGFSNMQDFKDSTQMIGVVVQNGLSLPERDYYLSDDAKFKKIRDAFVQHMQKMFILLGDNPKEAAKEAAIVMDIETQLARASLSKTELRNPSNIYHIEKLTQLEQDYPNFSWKTYLKAMDLAQLENLNLATPKFIQAMNNLMTSLPLEHLKIYLRWHLLDDTAPYLSQPFVDQNFKMISILSGTKELLPRWKRIVNHENVALGFAIGEIYVKKYFSPEAKREVLAIMHNIRQALHNDLKTLSWMTPATREAALKKLDLMEERVGYPDKWWDYSTLTIDRGPYVLNVLRANAFQVKRDLDKIGKPIDRSDWDMTPQTINAYYNPSMNNINIPTGILQPPFFDASAPDAVNYGAIGFVIGHEITHGFDDQGAKFDGYGNLNNWWTPTDLKRFEAATQCIVQQFSQYKIEGQPIKGDLVVGEATADLGGLTLAYHAFHLSEAYKKAQKIEGYTPDQQFFLGAAHVWANNTRPQQAVYLLTVDPHPPAMYRVNGTLANMPMFQTVFRIPKYSPMLNPNPCKIW